MIKILARSVQDVQHAIEHIFPLVYEFRKLRTPVDQEIWEAKRNARTLKRRYSESKAPSSGLGIDLSDEEDIVDSEEVDDWE